MRTFTFAMGGEAGYGIASSGITFSKIASRSGYFVYNYFEYPSLIRGGHNFFVTSFSDVPVNAPYATIDFLIALNQETIDKHYKDVSGVILIDSGQGMVVPGEFKGNVVDIPFYKMARDMGAILLRDVAALGAAISILGGDIRIFEALISEEFKDKSSEIREHNLKVARDGFDAGKKFRNLFGSPIKPQKIKERMMLVNGNQAAALGAISAGLQFAAIYPMTPTSNILHVLAPLQEEYGFIYKQPEDEISAINMAIGASFAGARSMVATSGGGFCLMTEGLGLAGITETPIVIIEGMRGGPATGLPTWTEQGDLRFVLHAHQGEFPRIVLAPGDAKETYEMVMRAFNLADIYQTPVIVLVDKLICESNQNFPVFSTEYKIERGKFSYKADNNYFHYSFSGDGISPRCPVGNGNYVIANSDEHDEKGYSTEEIEMRNAQMKKRMEKMNTCATNEDIDPVLYGDSEADLTIVSWGSTKGAVLEAMKQFNNVNFIHLNWINPFPSEKLALLLRKAKKILNIEVNYSAQLGGLITEKTGIKINDNLVKYDGRPFFTEELISEIKQRL